MNAQTQTIDEPEVDEPYYNSNLFEAPRDYRILLVIPTGDPSAPLEVETGHWDQEKGRFDGEWRYEVAEDGETPTAYANAEPIAWGEIPEPEDTLYALIGVPVPAAT